MNAYAAKDKKRKKRNDATKTDDDEKEGRAKRKTFIDTSTPESLTRDFYAWLYVCVFFTEKTRILLLF